MALLVRTLGRGNYLTARMTEAAKLHFTPGKTFRRISTVQDNRESCVKMGGKSKFRGVYWESRSEAWQARISSERRKKIYLGSFADAVTAAQFFDCAAFQLRGLGGFRNFPERVPSQGELDKAQERIDASRSRRKTSQYHGVYFDRAKEKWHARITVDKHLHNLGRFKFEAEAASAYDVALRATLPCRATLLLNVNFQQDADYFGRVTSWQDEPIPCNRSSRFFGVCWSRRDGKFLAYICQQHLGLFALEIEAAQHFDRASLAQGGRSNFHPSVYGLPKHPDSKQPSATNSFSPSSSSWVFRRCVAEQQPRAHKAAAAGGNDGTKLQTDAALWQVYLAAERRQRESRPSNAGEWLFRPGDIIDVRRWEDGNVSGQQSVYSVTDGEAIRAEHLADSLSRRLDSTMDVEVDQEPSQELPAKLNLIIRTFWETQSKRTSWCLGTGFAGNEAQSRMLINTVLLEICRGAGLTLHPEQSVPTSVPVAGVADYVLRRGSTTSAVVEAKRCCPSQWASLFTSAVAQTLTLLAAFSAAESQTGVLHTVSLGIVTDARRWLLVRLPQQGMPVLQCWPNGAVVLELSGPSALGLLVCSLKDMLGPKTDQLPAARSMREARKDKKKTSVMDNCARPVPSSIIRARSTATQ